MPASKPRKPKPIQRTLPKPHPQARRAFPIRNKTGKPFSPLAIAMVQVARRMGKKSRPFSVRELFDKTVSRFPKLNRQKAGPLLKRILHRLLQKGVFERVQGTQWLKPGKAMRKPPKRP